MKEKVFLFTQEGECMKYIQATKSLFAPATTSTALFEGPQYKTCRHSSGQLGIRFTCANQ